MKAENPLRRIERISDYLMVGKQYAQSASELADRLGIQKRQVSLIVSRERRSGTVILASTHKPAGYYLPGNDDEMTDYVGALWHRCKECLYTFFETKRAVNRRLKTPMIEILERGADDGHTDAQGVLGRDPEADYTNRHDGDVTRLDLSGWSLYVYPPERDGHDDHGTHRSRSGSDGGPGA